jgi:hypothetical protein
MQKLYQTPNKLKIQQMSVLKLPLLADFQQRVKSKSKAVPLHAMEALGGEEV